MLIFFLQILFFASFFYVSYFYQSRILESSIAISEYLNKLNLDDVSVAQNILEQKNVLGDDPLFISRSFNDVLRNFRHYMLAAFGLFVFGGSALWSASGAMAHKIDLKGMRKVFLRNLAVLGFYLGLIFLFFYMIFNVSLYDIALPSSYSMLKYLAFLIFAAVLLYFMFISLAISPKHDLGSLATKTITLGLRSFYNIFIVYLANILLFLAALWLLAYFLEVNLFMVIAALLLAVFSFVFGRLLILNVVEGIEN